jgi:superfamily II DNA or RNA helicase
MSTGLLTHRGLILPVGILKSSFKNKYDDFLEKLTVITPQKKGPPSIAKMYKCEKINGVSSIILPRFIGGALLKGKVISQMENLLPAVKPMKTRPILNCELFANQILILDYLCANIYTPANAASGIASCNLNFRAGCGKTYVAAGLIQRLAQRTLYVVPRKALKAQTVCDLREAFSITDETPTNITIGSYTKTPKKKDPRSDHKNQDVTVIVIDSALKQPKEFFAGYSLIIFDEIHMYCSDMRQEIFWKSNMRYQFGLSATTADRKDKRDIIYYKHLGEVINAESIPGFEYENVEFDCRVKIIRYNGPSDYTKRLAHASTGMMFMPYMIEQVLSDPYREQLALRELKSLYDWEGDEGQKHCIYIFCEEREPLLTLRDKIQTTLGVDVYAPEIGYFVGGIDDEQIIEIKRNARIILTTYGYSGTGTSMPKMTAMLLWTSRRANMKQILARIMRRGSDLSIPRIFIDLVDNKTPIRSQLSDRKIAYDFYQMKIDEQKINYTDIALPQR